MNQRQLIWVVPLLLLGACNQDDAQTRDTQQLAVERLEVSPTTAKVGESVTYAWKVRGDGATCQLDIGADGTPDYTLECAVGSQTHSFATPGSFPATLSVISGDQSISQDAPVVTVSDPDSDSDAFTELTWEPAAAAPYGIAEAQSVSLNGKLYAFGGFDSTFRCCRPTDRSYVFDPVASTWQAIAPLPPMNGTSYGGVTHAGFTTDGRDIYFAGGYTSNNNHTGQIFGTREVWRYNVAENSYTRLPDLPEARSAGQLEYYSGKLYFFGGSNDRRKADVGTLYIFDLASNATTWSEGASMPNPRNHLGAAVLGGKIYAIAGQHDHDGKLTTQADVHAYNPETDSWEQLASLPLAISHNTNSSFAMDGRIIVVGGETEHLAGRPETFAYSPETDSWTSLTPLPVKMLDPMADNVGGEIVVAYSWDPATFIGKPQ